MLKFCLLRVPCCCSSFLSVHLLLTPGLLRFGHTFSVVEAGEMASKRLPNGCGVGAHAGLQEDVLA